MDSNVEAHRNLLPFSGFISSTGTDGSLMVTDIFIFPDKLDGKLPCFCRLSHQVAGRFTEGQTRKRHLPQILANIADFDFPTEFVRLVTPVVHKMRAMPECLWCEISQNPTDPTHIRIQHGWTESTEWFTEVSNMGMLALD